MAATKKATAKKTTKRSTTAKRPKKGKAAKKRGMSALDAAAKVLAEAEGPMSSKEMIERMGYHRRDKEVEELEDKVKKQP